MSPTVLDFKEVSTVSTKVDNVKSLPLAENSITCSKYFCSCSFISKFIYSRLGQLRFGLPFLKSQ